MPGPMNPNLSLSRLARQLTRALNRNTRVAGVTSMCVVFRLMILLLGDVVLVSLTAHLTFV